MLSEYNLNFYHIKTRVVTTTTSVDYFDYDLVENDSRLSLFKYISKVELIDSNINNTNNFG